MPGLLPTTDLELRWATSEMRQQRTLLIQPPTCGDCSKTDFAPDFRTNYVADFSVAASRHEIPETWTEGCVVLVAEYTSALPDITRGINV